MTCIHNFLYLQIFNAQSQTLFKFLASGLFLFLFIVFDTARFQRKIYFPSTLNSKPAVSISSGLKVEKFRFRDGLVWTVGLTAEIREIFNFFQRSAWTLQSYRIRSPEQLTPHLSCLFPSRALQQRFRAFTMCTFIRLVALSKDKDTFTSPAGKSGNTYRNIKKKSTERRTSNVICKNFQQITFGLLASLGILNYFSHD